MKLLQQGMYIHLIFFYFCLIFSPGVNDVSKTQFVFEKASPAPTPKSPKGTIFNEDVLSTASSKSKSKSPPKSPRLRRKY